MLPLLEAKNLRKVYTSGGGLFNRSADENVALDNFSFKISGDKPVFISIAGESGSGKTTLAQLLLGFTKPTSGQVLFNGHDITTLSSQQMRVFRTEVQAVFQDPFAVYNPFYKVDHILNIPIQKFNLAGSKAEAHKKILEALQAVGLRPEDTLGRYPHQLSGGQRQRITVARTLLMKPKLVIADEPVSMVDASLRASILENMYSLHKHFGISFVYITHDLTTAYQVSDSIVVLYRGIVAEAGPVEQIIKNPQHPYTQELVQSIPLPSLESRSWLEAQDTYSLEAVEADVMVTTTGCKYAERCPHVFDMCRTAPPPLYRQQDQQAVSCYLYEDGSKTLEDDLSGVLGTHLV